MTHTNITYLWLFQSQEGSTSSEGATSKSSSIPLPSPVPSVSGSSVEQYSSSLTDYCHILYIPPHTITTEAFFVITVGNKEVTLDTTGLLQTTDVKIVWFIKTKALVVVTEDCDKVFDAKDSSFD